LKARLAFLSETDGSCDRDVPVVASHFYELGMNVDELSLPVLRDILSDPTLVLRDEDSLFEIVHRRAAEDLSYFALLEFVRFEFLSDNCIKTAFDFISDSFDFLTFNIWSGLRTRLTLPVKVPQQPGRYCLPAIESTIISEVPEFFSVFGGKTFRLLYRGSRDDFQAATFHNRCNGHPNTVTLISTTNGCICGAYTPIPWSSDGYYVSDLSMDSFVFTIKNPHNLPARIFRQKQAAKAVYHGGSYGPAFGCGHDLTVCNKCRDSSGSGSILGNTYTNDTRITGNEVLTGAQQFTVQEIEVFEVIWRQ
jgi:hypothetical protein